METTVEIAGQEMIVEYVIDITSHGSPGCAPSLNYPGDPPEPAEFDLTVLGLRFAKQDADVPDPEMPDWLRDIITTHLFERDDINMIAQEIAHENGGDPDLEYEAMRDREGEKQ